MRPKVWIATLCSLLLLACSGSSSGTPKALVPDPQGVLARQFNPYVVVDGQATTLGGASGTIGQVSEPVRVQLGHTVTVVRGSINWPRPTTSDPAVLAPTGTDYFGVFTALKAGTAQLLIDTTVCVRPATRGGCVLADVIVTADPPSTTTSTEIRAPTTSVAG